MSEKRKKSQSISHSNDNMRQADIYTGPPACNKVGCNPEFPFWTCGYHTPVRTGTSDPAKEARKDHVHESDALLARLALLAGTRRRPEGRPRKVLIATSCRQKSGHKEARIIPAARNHTRVADQVGRHLASL